MTKGHRTIAGLLSIIAALLAANLFVSLPPQEAKAQPSVTHISHRRVVQIDPHHAGSNVVVRLWSDGVIEWSVSQTPDPCSGDPWCDWVPIPDDVPPQPHARIVQIAHGQTYTTIYRLWSNGIVERNVRYGVTGCGFDPVWCGWVTVPE